MTDAPKDFADLGFSRQFCAIHGEPFRESWPSGALVFIALSLKEIVGSQEFDDETRRHFGLAPDAHISNEQLGAMFDLRPACCRLSSARRLGLMTQTFTDLKLGRKRFCSFCGKLGLGTPYRNKPPGEDVQTIPHVCLRCVCFHILPASS